MNGILCAVMGQLVSGGDRRALGVEGAFHMGEVLRDGRYEISELLRAAPEKKVYLARDLTLGFAVALDAFSKNGRLPSGQSKSAWEAQVLGRLGDHPNIATVIDHWEDGETAFMVSRYLPGGSLRDLVVRCRESGEPLSVERVLDFAVQISRALVHIHGHGFLYADLQPHNVLLDEWGAVHLVDFDTATLLDDPDTSALSRRSVIEHLAPELVAGEVAGQQADLYSLGATIYELCCGRPPYTGSREDILSAQRAGPPPVMNRDDLQGGFHRLVADLIATEPEQRPLSAREVVVRLERLRMARADLERFLASAETSTLEFKASLCARVDPRRPGDSRSDTEMRQVLQREAIDTLAAFLNTGGGTLLIGVKEDAARTVIGIEVDYPHVKGGSNDGWRLHFDNLITRDLGVEVLGGIDLELEPWAGRTIAVVRCHRRTEPTWIGDDLFVRRTASTVKLSARDAVAWCRERWR